MESITKLGKKKMTNKGITLIALVITIIVLLILAGVSIATLTGQNGVLTKADNAKKTSIQEEEKEQIKLAYNAAKMEKLENENTNGVVAEELQKELSKQKAGAEAVEQGIKIKVTFMETGNIYMLDNAGRIKDEAETQRKDIQFKINGITFLASEGDTWIDWFYDVKNGLRSAIPDDPDKIGEGEGQFAPELIEWFIR